MGNRVSSIVDQIPPDRWNHVVGTENPADSPSRGVFPSERLEHKLWLKGPPWLALAPLHWPKQHSIPVKVPPEEKREICLVSTTQFKHPVLPLDRYSTFTRLQRVTAWILHFLNNCRPSNGARLQSCTVTGSPFLTAGELVSAEKYLVKISREDHFPSEVASLQANRRLSSNSCLLSLHPFLDSDGILRVGGQEDNSQMSYQKMHPIILHGKHTLTKLIVRSQHLCMLNAGPTLLSSALCRHFHIVYMRKTVRSITRQCVTCRRRTTRPQPQMGQLPFERVTPGSVFEKVGVDYACPFHVKYGMVRKATTVKAYLCIFVSLAVKAVHLEVVSELTTEAFIATL